MSFGATAFTPQVTLNSPPFGFSEISDASDFPTCPSDPWSASDRIKEVIKEVSLASPRAQATLKEGFGFQVSGINFAKLLLLLVILWFVWSFLLN